jgi:hypothetical protein
VGVPDLSTCFDRGPPFYDRLARAISATALEVSEGRKVALVVHSGAGGLATGAIDAADGIIGGAVYVDALLPHPGRSWFDTLSEPAASRLRSAARSGYLPPWPSWLAPGAIEILLPDFAQRGDFIQAAPSLPLSFLEEAAPEPDNHSGCAWRGYIRLSDAYESEADSAEKKGWLVERAPAHHLAMLTAPDDIAQRLTRMIGVLASAPMNDAATSDIV